MILNQVIDQVKDLDIVDVIGKHVSLKRKGNNYQACCPFHGEKTPSFTVFPARGTFKCFGCGKGGDAISFVQELKTVDFLGAIRIIAGDHSINIVDEKPDPEAEKKHKHNESLFAVNDIAAKWFQQQLHLNEKALEYVKSRWSDDSIEQFKIGFAPDSWDSFLKYADGLKLNKSLLQEAGLLAESKTKVFDYFRNRIIFPINNSTGRVIGFTGRVLPGGDDNQPKYFNTSETAIYDKSSALYGFNFARRTAREREYVHLVEGNADVIRLHEIGKFNSVASCGTSLTKKQIEQIAKVCKSITIIGDSDKAGILAMERSGDLIVKEGLFCNVVMLPSDDGKQDPDSFFQDGDQFDEYVKGNIQDYLLWIANKNKNKAINPDKKMSLVNRIIDLLICLPSASHDLYIEKLAEIIKPKKYWQDTLKTVLKINEPEKDDGFKIPSTVKLSDFEKYGFYSENNCYFFKMKGGVVRGSNFIMEPLFHISSTMNAKRIYRIKNEFGYVQVIELLQRDLISLGAFKLRIESIGNFLFEASETELGRLKRYLYEKTDTCFEVTQLGWQKQGFWSWSNGIFTDQFLPVDINGIVSYNEMNFYLPASSNIYENEDTLFVHERRFKFSDKGKISLFDYSQKLIDVFGENARIAVCFYIATLFRDLIVKQFQFFPILNLFGPKGAGKTELAISIMQFFGHQAKGPNLTNTTKPALADHVAMFSNALCHIDEYKNNIEYEKIEFLKGLWDGTGRTRMNMDKDRKKETSSVDAGIVLSGQEMPTADIALFSRLIFLSFSKVSYSDHEKALFIDLKETEKLGLTHITHQILKHRDYFKQNFVSNYQIASNDLNKEIGPISIEDRTFRNWLIVLAAYRTLKEFIEVPWTYTGLVKETAQLIIRQNTETKKSNELSIFWSIIEYLAQNGEIKEEVDFRIDYLSMLKTDKIDTHWAAGKTIVYINHSRIFQLYRVHGKRTGENILPLKTLEYYLQNSKEYLGKKSSVAFKIEEDGKIVQDVDLVDRVEKKRRITTAMTFDYKELGITLDYDKSTVDLNQFVHPKLDKPDSGEQESFPF
ncbi:MAG: DNA primase [Bacteroidales bacterium]